MMEATIINSDYSDRLANARQIQKTRNVSEAPDKSEFDQGGHWHEAN